MGDFFRPQELSELVDLLSGRTLTILAGGTDYYPSKVGKLLDENIVDVTAVSALSGVTKTPAGWRIGAATSWSEIIAADLPSLFDGLKAAAREIGGQQIQNAGTIGGNICNASPAADGVPALMSLDAEVEITDKNGPVHLSLSDFILGNRRTRLARSQILTALHVPKTDSQRSKGSFLKLGSRKYLVISLAMIGGTVEWDSAGRITQCRLALGACSEVAQRLTDLEQDLIGRTLSSGLADRVEDRHFAGLAPIDDVRASGSYRQDAAKTLTQRLVRGWQEGAC